MLTSPKRSSLLYRAHGRFTDHGYGRLQQYLGRVLLPAIDAEGRRTVYTAVMECVGIPSLRDKNREHGADVIGILGRMFLRNAFLAIDGVNGRIEVKINEPAGSDRL